MKHPFKKITVIAQNTRISQQHFHSLPSLSVMDCIHEAFALSVRAATPSGYGFQLIEGSSSLSPNSLQTSSYPFCIRASIRLYVEHLVAYRRVFFEPSEVNSLHMQFLLHSLY
ncbi:hypothetical protein AVEN_65737-1 [Araneus ventricosus]|uniref:Uncharacterized protein n=1 Tax=Araneus ventricosus TaxID=182803 RepID=A0A4Y2P734_ARAVE|nr:hypothetical protein AVEN_39068-1 [Araneus ventricosus]GBN96969.1 hypothetical protein AVEN_65737-1 [Araneus ventricosus]